MLSVILGETWTCKGYFLFSELALKNEQQLAALLITIIQHSTMLPFRWHKGRFMCFYCSSTFNTSSALKDHDRDGHIEINITDIVTRVMYNDRRIKLDVATARCSQCNQQITDISDYIEHLYEKHDADFDSDVTKLFVSFRLSDDEMTCVECGLHFQYFGQLLIHTNKTHMNKHVCEICGQGVVGKVNIYNHMKQMHAIKVCKYCDETFNTQYALFQHVSTMHKTDGLKCSVCGEFQQNRYKMKRHMALVHDCKNLQKICEYCSKVFTRNNKYVQHKERVHFKQKNITCDVCGYGAYDAAALKLHMVCHEKAMPYSCACGKRFRRSKNLIVHKTLCPELADASKNAVAESIESNIDRVVRG